VFLLPVQLSVEAGRAIEQASGLFFSVVSFAAIGVKAAIGKLDVPADLRDRVLAAGLSLLALTADHGLAVAELFVHHRDPFDGFWSPGPASSDSPCSPPTPGCRPTTSTPCPRPEPT
jgi:PIN domain nuclease of toxin-antitoxin system